MSGAEFALLLPMLEGAATVGGAELAAGTAAAGLGAGLGAGAGGLGATLGAAPLAGMAPAFTSGLAGLEAAAAPGMFGAMSPFGAAAMPAGVSEAMSLTAGGGGLLDAFSKFGAGLGKATDAIGKVNVKLKMDGDKATGKLISPGRQGGDPVETEIKEGKIKDGELTFTVTREFNGNKMVSKYTGKVTPESIKGKIETERDGQTRSRDWEAKRVKEQK